MKKLACVLTAVSLLGVATPASAQYFYAGGDGFAVGIGGEPYYGWGGPYAYGGYDGGWWGGPYGYGDSYAYGGGPYADGGSWWGGPYNTAGYGYGDSYGYGGSWWGGGYRAGPGFRGYAHSPGCSSYAYAPGCRIVKVRRHLGDGTVVVRRSRVC